VQLSDLQIAGYAWKAGFRGADLATAVALTHPESGGDPGAVQKGQPAATTGWGLWQITPGGPELLDPQANANEAFRKYKQANGFSPWTTYTNGSYARWLPQAQQAASQLGGGSGPAGGLTAPGTGLLAGRTGDAWGIGQAVANAAGYTGGTLRGIGTQAVNTATVGAGLLVLAAGVLVLGYLFLSRTDTGRGIQRGARDAVKAGKVAAEVAVVAPK